MRFSVPQLSALLLLVLLSACSASRKTAITPVVPEQIRFIGEYAIPFGLEYQQTTVGGLSGIDYDPAGDRYYFICDDRSDKNPARFYEARIRFNDKGIDTVEWTGVRSLLSINGQVYPNNKQDPSRTPDPEAMRYNPRTRQLVWSSEGERILRGKDTVLTDPSINIITMDGRQVDSFPLPPQLHMQAIERGPRQNGVLEGMSFADRYKTLYVSVEEPLYEDGPRADTVRNGAYIRLLQFDVASKKNTAQYAYELEPVATPAKPATAFKINGVPDILGIGENKLLVIERSFSTGTLACTIRVYVADLSGATDISNQELRNNRNFVPVQKKLLFNMNDLGIYIDNIEGVTFGPRLPNGHQTLLFVADNNFSPAEKAQLLLFEIVK